MVKKTNMFLIISIILISSFRFQSFSEEEIVLPAPKLEGKMSVEEALARRRSRRNFRDDSLSMVQVGQLLWSAQGITGGSESFRTAPSAAKVYPTEIYLVVGKDKVTDLTAGVYHYNPLHHSLEVSIKDDLRKKIAQSCLDKNQIEKVPICLIITVDFSRLRDRYGERWIHFANIFGYMEAGHVAQNVYLQAESLGLGTVSMGGIKEKDLSQILNLPENYTPLYVMPVGYY